MGLVNTGNMSDNGANKPSTNPANPPSPKDSLSPLQGFPLDTLKKSEPPPDYPKLPPVEKRNEPKRGV